MASSGEMVPASKRNFLQPPVDSHKLRFPTRYEFAYGVNPAGNTNTYTFIAVVENSVRMRQDIGFTDRHSRVRGNPVFSRENGNPEN